MRNGRSGSKANSTSLGSIGGVFDDGGGRTGRGAAARGVRDIGAGGISVYRQWARGWSAYSDLHLRGDRRDHVVIQTRTSFGLSVFAIGENAAAARLCGLALTRVRTLVYLTSGAGAGIAGVILAAQVRTASANYGNGIELDVIAAIVLGGTSLKGDSGAIYRSVIGALLIGGMKNGLSILNVSTDLQLVTKGVIIVMAIALDNFLYRWSES
jgi:hypothetical protein